MKRDTKIQGTACAVPRRGAVPGWIRKSGDQLAHWYLHDYSICLQSDILDGRPLLQDFAFRCRSCKKILAGAMGRAYSGRKRRLETDMAKFEKKHGLAPMSCINNYVNYDNETLDIGDVLSALSKWGDDVDWRACITRSMCSGMIRPGKIRRLDASVGHLAAPPQIMPAGIRSTHT